MIVCLAWGGQAGAADISGAVVYNGAAPARAKLPVTIDQYICGKEKDAENLVLSEKRGVSNAVVWLENPPNGAGWGKPLPKIEMDQKGCVFVPRVVVVPVGGTVDFLNSDRLLHNLHSKSRTTRRSTAPSRMGASFRSLSASPRSSPSPATCTRGCAAGWWSPSTRSTR
jgi:hypothetical protein